MREGKRKEKATIYYFCPPCSQNELKRMERGKGREKRASLFVQLPGRGDK